MLSEEVARWLLAKVESTRPIDGSAEFERRIAEVKAAIEAPLELLIFCPVCKEQHIDEGKFAKEPHKIHACQFCGLGFAVSKHPSVGVRFFSGWKNSDGLKVTPSGPPVISPPTLSPGQTLDIALKGTVEASSNPGIAHVGDQVTVILNHSLPR